VNSLQLPTVVSYDRLTFLRSLFHEPTLVSAIGHSQLLDHGCGTAFRPTYDSLSLPFISPAGGGRPPGVKDVFVCLTETPAPSDFCSSVLYKWSYLLNNLLTITELTFAV